MAIQSPEGTFDLLPDEAEFWARFKATAAEVFGRYGYVTIETPIVERTELFVRGIGEATDVVSKEMFTAISGENLKRLTDGGSVKSSSRLSLRPEGTAGVVRAVVQHDLVPQGAAPAKLMYAGQMFRAERPQKGRQRQFNQVGIECLGAEAPSVDAEGIIMLMRFFEAVGIPVSATRLLVNSMGCEECRPAYREAVRAYMAEHETQLCEECLRRADINPLRAFDCKNEGCRAVMDGAPKITDHLCDSCRDHYEAVKSYLDAAGLTYVEDHKLVRGLDYYTRTVFEVQVTEGMGSQNAIGGGGRYDKLAQEVGGRATPGFGFALGFERCVLALRAAGVEFPRAGTCDLFVACAGDEARPQAFFLVQAVRDAGRAAEQDHQARSLKSQFKLANKLGARYVITLGSDELATGTAVLRNMETHEETPVDLADVSAIVAALE
ncbi:histidine--tRNA ligase [Adlercreutzia sp. ZJ138]|uniref:histidine--tRNA ligase n=1 Tax=Adlercreutzia sp. ZJ138 TaxID=2709405 RepID=UPI0013ED5F5A|nr:histidine--tRNA ligase [Adlercreutzia sp. ZJ138]